MPSQLRHHPPPSTGGSSPCGLVARQAAAEVLRVASPRERTRQRRPSRMTRPWAVGAAAFSSRFWAAATHHCTLGRRRAAPGRVAEHRPRPLRDAQEEAAREAPTGPEAAAVEAPRRAGSEAEKSRGGRGSAPARVVLELKEWRRRRRPWRSYASAYPRRHGRPAPAAARGRAVRSVAGRRFPPPVAVVPHRCSQRRQPR